jgi:hypothetical protein
MTRRLSPTAIRNLGFEWPKYALIEEYAVKEGGKVDLAQTVQKLDSSRAFYQGQLNAAYAFKQQHGADYSDFTDRFDEYARRRHDLSAAITYLEKIIEAAEG